MKTTPKSTLALLWLAAVALLWAGAAGATAPLSDPQISEAVDDRLMDDTATPAWNIDVTTIDGIVTLAGSVDNILARDRAERLAATVKGVRGVVNRLDVDAPFRTDTEILENVRDALMWDPATESWEIGAEVDGGVVTLTGEVDSWQEKQLAAKVAKGVRGVRGLENEISVDYAAGRRDLEIQEEIEKALRWDAYIDDALVRVAVDDGDVTLSGTVGSAAEKTRAAADARVAGVQSVDTRGLAVKWWTRNDRLRRDKFDSRTDAEIEAAVRDTLLYDPRVVAANVEVGVDEGSVTLRGKVDNLKAKRAAAEDARGVVGVWAVDNRIKVRPGTPSDETIEENVEAALAWDPYVERYQVTVSVVDGEVYLYGDVDSTFEKAQADDVAARQAGVRGVNNFLDVNAPGSATYDPYTDDWYVYNYDWYTFEGQENGRTDWEIAEDIRDELYWSPYVDRDDITVTVDDGVAELTGTVGSWAERRAAGENARQGGAVYVDNDLAVVNGPEYYRP